MFLWSYRLIAPRLNWKTVKLTYYGIIFIRHPCSTLKVSNCLDDIAAITGTRSFDFLVEFYWLVSDFGYGAFVFVVKLGGSLDVCVQCLGFQQRTNTTTLCVETVEVRIKPSLQRIWVVGDCCVLMELSVGIIFLMELNQRENSHCWKSMLLALNVWVLATLLTVDI